MWCPDFVILHRVLEYSWILKIPFSWTSDLESFHSCPDVVFNLLLWPCSLLNLWRWRQTCICHFELCNERWQSSCSCPDVEPDWSKTWSQLLRCSMIFRSTPSTAVSWTLYTIRNHINLGSKRCWYSHDWNFPRSPDLSVVFNHPYAFSSVLWMLLLSLSHRSLCCHLIKLG